MDKSFQGLVLSLIVHAILLWLYLHAPAPDLSRNEPTEVEYLTPKEMAEKKRAMHVTETEKEEVFQKLKDRANYLAKYAKRVKQETIASNNGETKNAMPTPEQLRPQALGKMKNQGTVREEGESQSGKVGGMGGLGGHSQMRTQAIGVSSIAEFIPGVQEGAFTALNTDQDIYYTFYQRMNEQVRNRWVTAIRNYVGGLTAKQMQTLALMDRYSVVEIVLRPDGEFESSAVFNSSGDRVLDQAGIDAFRMAAPFGNPPKGMVQEDNKIRLKYGFMVQFRPPSVGGNQM